MGAEIWSLPIQLVAAFTALFSQVARSLSEDQVSEGSCG